MNAESAGGKFGPSQRNQFYKIKILAVIVKAMYENI